MLFASNDWWATEKPDSETAIFDWEVMLWVYNIDVIN